MTAAAFVVTPAYLAGLLVKVPEKTFRIKALAPQLLTKGKVDIEKCMERQPEIDLAIQEVRTYVIRVNGLLKTLFYLGYKGDDMAEEDFADDDYDPYTDPTRDESFL